VIWRDHLIISSETDIKYLEIKELNQLM
jgi:hypothetical protein